ncbi:hypothetical protein [Amycolatopsis sp. YIM 10]|uniref:hypothetical protein n=1 Tax=Amycolatopsis sp. YIM 10 TaxID=2653857 RepID=UPI0012906EC1|nr:hypothetical protein [Amycolatopsis sp. YIM 10]QFU92065.1 hypothetical protein YIM_34520 [Amycolatopsis sp. YIM 10]
MVKLIAALTGTLVLLGGALVVLFLAADPSVDLALEGAKTVMNLIVAVIVTGVLSVALAHRASNRAAHEERKVVLVAALRNLKAGYEQVQLARFFLSAHRTGATLVEQVSRLAEARSFLHLVQRERYLVNTEIDDHVQQMLNYIRGVSDEYLEKYQKIAEAALREERARKQFVDGAVDELPEQPVLCATEFPRLNDFVQPPELWKLGYFDQNYRAAKGKLEDWLTGRAAPAPPGRKEPVRQRGARTTG